MRKVQASALYFVLIISLIVLVLITTFISFIYFQRQYFSTYEGEKRVNDNLRFAEMIYENDEAFRTSIKDSIMLDLFGLGEDSVQINQSTWGFFKLLEFKASYKNTSKKGVMFYANSISDTDTLGATLYLRDKQNLLSLAGDTKIYGLCFLPKAGVKPAIVEGKPFQGKKLIEGEIKNSTAVLPLIDSSVLKEAIKMFDSTFVKEKFSPYTRYTKLEGNIAQAFTSIPMAYIAKEEINLHRVSISGHCIIYSSKEINVYRDAELNDVILVAPIVRFKEGFKGNVQVFAKDTILIEDGVHISYPSVLFAYQTKENDSKIKVKKNAKIIGTILSVDESVEDKNGRIEIDKGVVIKGSIWCEGYLDVNGRIEGGIVTHKFIKNTTATIYENHMLDVTMNSRLRSNKFLYPSLFFSKKVNLLKTLK